MAQIINLIVTAAEMLGLKGVSNYSRSSSVGNFIIVCVLAASLIGNVYSIEYVAKLKLRIARLKIEAKEIIVLRQKVIERDASIEILKSALALFVPTSNQARGSPSNNKPTPNTPEPVNKVNNQARGLPQRELETPDNKKSPVK
jgi:hypothetical protein